MHYEHEIFTKTTCEKNPAGGEEQSEKNPAVKGLRAAGADSAANAVRKARLHEVTRVQPTAERRQSR